MLKFSPKIRLGMLINLTVLSVCLLSGWATMTVRLLGPKNKRVMTRYRIRVSRLSLSFRYYLYW